VTSPQYDFLLHDYYGHWDSDGLVITYAKFGDWVVEVCRCRWET
jgi:hypothetical protein